MKLTSVLVLLVALALASKCNAYRILAVFPFNAKSHNIVLEAVAKSLAKHGHQVDVVGHYPPKKPIKNYNHIINLDGTMDRVTNNLTLEMAQQLSDNLMNLVTDKSGNRVCDIMSLESMQKLFKNPPQDPPYDVVLTEAFASHCYFGLGHIFKVPVVAISTAVEYPWVSHFIGNDDNLAYVSNAFYLKVGKLNYWDRVKNFVTNYMALYKYQAATNKYQTEAMQKYLSPDIPDIREVEKNVALTLVNSHPVIYGVKPITPSLVQVGGIHVEINDDTLSPELQKWMDESKNGVIFFTLGSMVLVESMPAEKLKEIYAVFEKLAPMRVFMKVVDNSKLPPGLPKNVKTWGWIPQIPVLAHPNIKLFITHGGLGGLIEALYYGVPMVGIPLFCDQFRNCELFAEKKMMVTLQYEDLSGERLDSAVQTVLNDADYKKNAVFYSKLFRDQPLSPVKSAVFWIEHVIRNGPVLRSPALDYDWWQLALLDVYALFLFAFIAGLISIIFVIRLLLKILGKILSNSSDEKTHKKK